ncbi:hypothetical protein [Ancylobacter oerskovii]|uniref:Uncharacterized protein n=1 Tax=Ancylobacter oerskovii TaxID=459519 RepID=A0ABW4Z4T9_9HYPH|nr:hypothetical protein [Ancylobacter oerskovii]
MLRRAEIMNNNPPILSDVPSGGADGVALALRSRQLVAISGDMPEGGFNRVDVDVCSISALLMKGHALNGRQSEGHLLVHPQLSGGDQGLGENLQIAARAPKWCPDCKFIAEKFNIPGSCSPTSVRKCVTETAILDAGSP